MGVYLNFKKNTLHVLQSPNACFGVGEEWVGRWGLVRV